MGPALLELYATPTSIKRQISEKRESSPKLFNSPLTGRPMTRTLSMKAEILKDIDSEKKLPSARSIESTHSLDTMVKKGSSQSMGKYFRLKFIGSAILDRRYTLPMLPWIISDIKRNSSQRGWKDVELEVNDLCLKATMPYEKQPLFVHSHQFISKFAANPLDKTSFIYLYRDHPDSPSTCYLFQGSNENTVSPAVKTTTWTDQRSMQDTKKLYSTYLIPGLREIRASHDEDKAKTTVN